MSNDGEILQEARARGIISPGQHDQLLTLQRELSGAGCMPGGYLAELNQPNDADDDAEDSRTREMPRFVRGFHDVIITIGIIAVAMGAVMLFDSAALIPLSLLLAEIFVRRQRLALPAFTLTATFMIGSFYLASRLLDGAPPETRTPLLLAIGFAALALFYWRYRAPVALACLIASGIGALFTLTLTTIAGDGDYMQIGIAYPRLVGVVSLGFALLSFAIAMRFDTLDPGRVTRRSDVAFWLHLVTAPALLYSLSLLIFHSGGLFWALHDALNAIITIVIVAAMMLVGILIDRRAFVTSGLISLGAAVYYMFVHESGLGERFQATALALSLVVVGLVVLSLGSCWRASRGLIVPRLPPVLQAKLPPVQKAARAKN